MLDWLSLRLPIVRQDGSFVIPREDIDRLTDQLGRLICISGTGELEWQAIKWESVRSDTHQLVVRVTDHVCIQGSPARCGQNDNVFGSFDVLDCFHRMVSFASHYLAVDLPRDPGHWQCRRVDVTQNYDLKVPAIVRQALLYLKQSEGGHYQTSTSSETIYWNQRSRLRSGKAYHKGPHLRKQVKASQAQACSNRLDLSDRLLRLELRLGGQFWRERATKNWYEFTESDWIYQHESYFKNLVGNLRVKDMSENSLYDSVVRAANTPGAGQAAWKTYLMIKSEGMRQAQSKTGKRSWYRHLKILHQAGFSLAQLQSPTVVPIVRYRTIELGNPVRSWEELEQRARAA
ncbi:MAG: phage/plasmid replication protein, II/X family [Pseudomonadota bacterium]